MDDSKPQRRPLRFSLRRLISWTAVWAAYLVALHFWLVYLRNQGVPHTLPVGIGFTVYVAMLLPLRITLGAQRGAWIAVLGTFLVLACLAEISVVMNCWSGQSSETIIQSQWVLGLCFTPAILLSAIGYLFAHTLVVAVDWVDSLMQTKPRQDE